MNKLIKEWLECDKIKVFEFRVIDNRDNFEDWVTFDIDIVDNQFVARHEPLNALQAASSFIPSVVIPIDVAFSLDENLVELYDACVAALSESEFYLMAGGGLIA